MWCKVYTALLERETFVTFVASGWPRIVLVFAIKTLFLARITVPSQITLIALIIGLTLIGCFKELLDSCLAFYFVVIVTLVSQRLSVVVSTVG